ncbi:MAG: methyltransferase family protein [Terriglobia bacterium]
MDLWGLWVLSWLAAMFWSNRTEKRAGLGAEAGYRAVLILGGILLFIPAHGYQRSLRLWHVGWNGAWICVALVALGFIFCWWARIHLGRLWSGTVTRKADHHIVDTGPYALVRHPIYTGLLLSVFATTAAKGTVPGVAGAIVIAIGLWMKARLEERWLSQELGAEAYAAYRVRVPMLVPFGPKGRRS